MTQTLTTFYGKNQNADTLTAKIKHILETKNGIYYLKFVTPK